MSNDQQDKKHSSQRRGFLKGTAAGLLGVAIGTRILTDSTRALAQAGAKAPAVDPKDPQAQSLGYSADAKKVDTKKFPKRAGAEGAKQFCYNCQFFQGGTDPKKMAEAPCQIFAGKVVKSHAWCNTWTQNPTVKG